MPCEAYQRPTPNSSVMPTTAAIANQATLPCPWRETTTAANSGPIDEPTSDDRFLGFETDFYANWQVSSDIAVVLRYGVFFPGEAIETDSDARHLFYAGVTYAF